MELSTIFRLLALSLLWRNTQVQFNQVRANEFEAVSDILHENAIWLLSKGILQWPLDWLESIRSEIKASVDSGLFYAVHIDNKLAAVVEIRTASEDIWGNNQTKALYIHKLAICRKYSGSGLGQKILNRIKFKAIQQNINYLRLDCVAHNNKLREYYESCEFKLMGIVKAGEINLALYEHQIQSSQHAA
jgi:GNAT superfamily N-acetyltransferase